LLAIDKVASRNIGLIDRWFYNKNGKMTGFLYSGLKPVGDQMQEDSVSTTEQVKIPIPIEKVIHFNYDSENESPTGFGLWRSMYPHWYIKQGLYKIMCIGIERNLVGVPVGKMGQDAQPEDKQAFKAILQRLRAAEEAVIVLPEGYDVDWFESRKNPMDAMEFVHHHNVMIAQVALAQFLNLGQQAVGTQSLAETQSKMFMDSEEANATWIQQTIQKQLIDRWTDYNYGSKVRSPQLKHRKISSRDNNTFANILNILSAGNWVQPTIDDTEYLRSVMELPELPREQLEIAKKDAEQKLENTKPEIKNLGGNPDVNKKDKEPIDNLSKVDNRLKK
jgi:hypothetical protein